MQPQPKSAGWAGKSKEKSGVSGFKVGVVYAVGGTDPDSHPPAHSLAWSTVMGCFGRSASKSDAEESKQRKEANKRINQQIQKDKQVYRATHRLLLLGNLLQKFLCRFGKSLKAPFCSYFKHTLTELIITLYNTLFSQKNRNALRQFSCDFRDLK